MIVFVAPFPALADEKDGLIQRVASIDSLVSNQPRVYLDISFRRFWFKRIHHIGEATVFQLNGLLHFFIIIAWIKKANIVYIHSVFNALKALSAYWITKPITDLHGAVPEELIYQGYRGRAKLYGIVEQIALRRSANVIYVTSAMKRHFQQKYESIFADDLTIAILPNLLDARNQGDNILTVARDPKAVVYAGGLQDWQNISMMLNAAADAPKFHFLWLTGEPETLQRLAELKNIVHFTCTSVAPDKVADHYLTSTYGFVLRDPVLLNQVACPTKLVEYMHWGVIPIILTSAIGDFAEFGFAYVTLDDFRLGTLPDNITAANMREINQRIVTKMVTLSKTEIVKLRQLLLCAN